MSKDKKSKLAGHPAQPMIIRVQGRVVTIQQHRKTKRLTFGNDADAQHMYNSMVLL